MFFKEADVETKGLKKILSSGKRTPPRVSTIMANSAETPTAPSTDGPTSNFIVFDGCVVDVGTACTKQAVLTLISTYYVFSLEYPKIYSQVLVNQNCKLLSAMVCHCLNYSYRWYITDVLYCSTRIRWDGGYIGFTLPVCHVVRPSVDRIVVVDGTQNAGVLAVLVKNCPPLNRCRNTEM